VATAHDAVKGFDVDVLVDDQHDVVIGEHANEALAEGEQSSAVPNVEGIAPLDGRPSSECRNQQSSNAMP
jgi:hypothetical protein